MLEFFPNIAAIEYEGPFSTNPLSFKYYNCDEFILGKQMKDWLRFSSCFMHRFEQDQIPRPWDEGKDGWDNTTRYLRANFELLSKLGFEYYSFYDRDLASEGATLEETNKKLDSTVTILKQLQSEYEMKPLWGSANLFSDPIYLNGAATHPHPEIFAYAAAQVKKAMEITHELGGENYLFWGGREGYQTLLNTDLKRELDHMARFLSMAAEYKKKLGFTGTLLLIPNSKQSLKHHYDFDCETMMGFLREYRLDSEFKLNIDANHSSLANHSFEHELEVSACYGFLGSINANSGDPSQRWRTDRFHMDLKTATMTMLIVLHSGGLGTGGLNFDAQVRRESVDLEDMFIAYINGMDTLAKGLRIAARIFEEGILHNMLLNRYRSWNEGIGLKIEHGETNFEELEEYTLNQKKKPSVSSGKQELFEALFNQYVYSIDLHHGT